MIAFGVRLLVQYMVCCCMFVLGRRAERGRGRVQGRRENFRPGQPSPAQGTYEREAEGWEVLGAAITDRVREMAGEKEHGRANGGGYYTICILLDRLLAGGDKCRCGACIVDLARYCAVHVQQVTFPIDMRGEQNTKRGPVDPHQAAGARRKMSGKNATWVTQGVTLIRWTSRQGASWLTESIVCSIEQAKRPLWRVPLMIGHPASPPEHT